MNSQREIQTRYAEVLQTCYQLYLRGRRCRFENKEMRRYHCRNCPENNSSYFCKANLTLKKLIRVLAESMAAEGSVKNLEAGTDLQKKGTRISEEQIKNFKALNLEIALSSPKVKETIWLVPERSGNHEFELTPEDVRILDAVTTAFGANLVEITKAKDN